MRYIRKEEEKLAAQNRRQVRFEKDERVSNMVNKMMSDPESLKDMEKQFDVKKDYVGSPLKMKPQPKPAPAPAPAKVQVQEPKKIIETKKPLFAKHEIKENVTVNVEQSLNNSVQFKNNEQRAKMEYKRPDIEQQSKNMSHGLIDFLDGMATTVKTVVNEVEVKVKNPVEEMMNYMKMKSDRVEELD